MIFLDTSVIIDLVEVGTRWHEWARDRLVDVADDEPIVINPIVLAESSRRFDSLDNQLSTLSAIRVAVRPLDAASGWLAGRAHNAYRRAGGPRSAILADFLIGGHALSLGATLMTRDRQRFAGYFPDLSLLTPETHP